MLKNISRILPFFIITLLCIVGVELFYGIIERFLLVPEPITPVAEQARRSSMVGEKKPEQHTNYRVIVERNLFQTYLKSATEVPQEENENPLEGLQATSLDLILLGTIAGPAEQSRAIIMDKGKKKQDIYYQGDVVQQAIIKEIMRGKVILSYNGKDEILDMTEAASMRPKAQVANGPPLPQVRGENVFRRSPVRRRQPPVAREEVRENPQDEVIDQEIETDSDADVSQDNYTEVQEEQTVEEEMDPALQEYNSEPDRATDINGRELPDN